jgi:hypothetical protein
MKTTKILKSFNDLAEDPKAWLAQPQQPDSGLTRFWNEANAPREDLDQPEEFAAARPVRGWGINE